MLPTIHPVDMAYFDALLLDILDDQKNIQLARRYHDGDQDVYLNARVQEFLGMHANNKFRMNVCRTVVSAVVDELDVVGFDTGEVADQDGRKRQAEWAWSVWTENHMDTIQDDVHQGALRDREAFVIVEWDNEKKRPAFTFNKRFVDTAAGGDGEGCWMIYENDDPNQRPLAAVKQWTEVYYDVNGFKRARTRRNIYYPERIEKWVNDGQWRHYEEAGREWPIKWKSLDGRPIGIPVIHFKNKDMRPEAWDAIPLQDAVNKLLVDVLASSDMSAFRLLVAIGWYPTTDGSAPKPDGSNLLRLAPGQIIGTTKSKSEAGLEKIGGEDVTHLVNTLKDVILFAAQITDTPASRFITTRQVAGNETLKGQEKPLKKKAADRRGLFGGPWAECMEMARRLANLYDGQDMDENVEFVTLWQTSEDLSELEQKMKFGIPLENLWAEIGYTPQQIAAMKKSQEYKLRMEKILMEGAKAAADANIPLETYLRRVGVDAKEIGKIGTEKMAEINADQEDVTPPFGQ